MGIFLDPETTFSVDVKQTARNEFEVVEGGPYKLRTATGREFAALSKAFREKDDNAGFDILARHLVSGIEAKDVERLHPSVVAVLLLEVARRSRLSETDAGN